MQGDDLQVSLHETISSTVEMVAAEASRKGLDIAYTMDDDLLRRTLLGDAIRIRQVGAPASPPPQIPHSSCVTLLAASL
jgi:hypothetical protein